MPLSTWIVSRSGGANSSSARVVHACRRLDVPCIEVRMIPFSRELPSIPNEVLDGPIVFYGQTSLILAAYASPWRRGVWFDPSLFRPSVYLRHLGDRLLNADLELTTVRNLAASPREDEERIFVRPDDDLKGFSGGIMTMAEFRRWRVAIGAETDGDVSADTPIVVAAPKEIGREYRAVVAGGKVATLDAADGRGAVPKNVARCVEEASGLWQPVPVFVVDVAETECGPKILELNCFNASGLYAEDATAMVRAVSDVLAWPNG